MSLIPAKILINGQSASAAWFHSIKEMTVEQNMGLASEARILFPIVLDNQGVWTDLGGGSDIGSGQRVRIEVSTDGERTSALIDGEVVSVESRQSSEPGQSLRVWVIRDDVELLDRDENVWVFEKESADQVAKSLFNELSEVFAEVTVEAKNRFQTPGPQAIAHRGTRWDLLKKLARIYGVEAFVRPGGRSGTSKGYFVKVPRNEDRKSNLWINGAERNLEEVELLEDFQQATQVQSKTLVLQQKQNFDDTADPGNAGRMQFASINVGQAAEASTVAKAEAERSRRDVLINAKVTPGKYQDVLEAYSWVKVGGLGERYSGDFLVRRVLHRFLGGTWEQEVGLLGTTNEKRAPSLGPVGRIF